MYIYILRGIAYGYILSKCMILIGSIPVYPNPNGLYNKFIRRISLMIKYGADLCRVVLCFTPLFAYFAKRGVKGRHHDIGSSLVKSKLYT
jgi:hypothetical protein